MIDVGGHRGQIFNAKLNTRKKLYKPLSNHTICIANSIKSNAGKGRLLF